MVDSFHSMTLTVFLKLMARAQTKEILCNTSTLSTIILSMLFVFCNTFCSDILINDLGMQTSFPNDFISFPYYPKLVGTYTPENSCKSCVYHLGLHDILC